MKKRLRIISGQLRTWGLYSWALAAVHLPAQTPAPEPLSGEALYAQHCASCHGAQGEGVKGKYEDVLQGERSLESLASYIDRTMPEDNPDALNAEESRRVAAYMMDAFYSPEARARLQQPQRVMARLTVRQYRESIADLLRSFVETKPHGPTTGLIARYYQSDGMNKKAKQVLEREDRALSFDFGEGPPVEGITPDQFSIAWDGSLAAPITGWYEFRLTTPNGARFYLNTDLDRGDANFRDDSGAKRQPAFLDGWVSSGSMERQITGRMFLLGGRRYPLRLDYFKYQEPRGMVRLEWKRPYGEWEVLATPYLSPAPANHVPVVDRTFPPDDASEGYERGTEVSKAWHETVTNAALDVANQVLGRLGRLSRTKIDDPEREAKLKDFLAIFAERAFRRPLTPELRTLYIDRIFEPELALEEGVKRSIILILTSPRFLYPELVESEPDDYTIATRLALALWDSLPDDALWQAAREGRLRSPAEVRAQAQRMEEDPRARAKLMAFFYRWLKLDAEGELAKDATTYPGFDAALAADLRRSLELFVENIIWNGSADYRELLQADYMWVNQRLAQFYGLPVPEEEGFHPVKCPPGQRAGIVTHPYILARLAYHNNSSPIHRGVFLTRQILGRFLKPPSEAVAFNNDRFDPTLTMREKVTNMTAPASCMNCHQIINPLGFTLEHFDGAGRFREIDNHKPVDSVADYETPAGDVVRLGSGREVAALATATPEARRGFVRQLFQAVVKQNPNAYDPDTLERLEAAFDASGQNIRRLFVEIATLASNYRGNDRPTVQQASR